MIAKPKKLASEYRDNLRAIEEWYRKIQSRFVLYEIDKAVGSVLLNPQIDEHLSVHHWYVLKEAFSLQLPVWVVERVKTKFKAEVARVFDPFIGCGTTGCALSPLGISVDGLEYNPFIRFAASTKANARLVNKQSANMFINAIHTKVPKLQKLIRPRLSTIHEAAYFRRDDIRFVLYVLQEINSKVSCKYTQNFLKLGVAKSLEPISNLCKDGRALRYVRKSFRPTAPEMLIATWKSMLNDIPQLRSSDQSFRVFSGDARDLSRAKLGEEVLAIESEVYDLVIYSPPYLNNFDYSEIYKVELWLLGYVSNYEEWKELRKQTIRSHHSLKFEETRHLQSDKRTQRTSRWIDAIASSEALAGYAAKNMPPIIKGYFDDMYLTLKEQFRILRPGGFLIYVVANSRHANLPIATDVILGEIARNIGFRAIELNVLKKRNGRTKQKNYLRESAVIMQKPE